ncbi:MAG: SET domain-containing protein-lysine N-methyltransferase [Flavisolibacter sp.]
MTHPIEKLMEVRESKFGKGLFALTDIGEGSILCKVSGTELEMDFATTLALKNKESHALQIDHDRYILCEPPFLYSNHSCNPNCGVNSRLEMLALKHIRAGQELLWDYSTSMLERHWTMKCSCGEAECRKIITDFDLLPQELQLNYLHKNIVLPFIVSYLQQHLAKTA